MRLFTKFTLFFSILLMLILIPLETYAAEKGFYKIVTNENTKEEILVGSLPEANVKLYATERTGLLENFRLHLSSGDKYLPFWFNVSNRSYWPSLFYKDINQDGKKELIFVLTTGYGNDTVKQNVHVFHEIKTDLGNAYEETLVDNPMAIILKNVKTNLTKSEAIITLGNKKTVIKIDELGVDPKHLFPDIAIGNITEFEILDNKLTANMGASVSPAGGYLGDFHITYTFKDKMYQVEKIEFIPNK
ncbi:hypothetical protein [Niallia sp. FSL R7-0271]|uniref:hypothetical protein n=1 Tax=Niallia sp. FSL R7-0271 TaxID=2921678 RepID=UPI0030F527A6